MVQQRKNGWKWHFVTEADRELFGAAPEAETPDTISVKETAVRKVFRKNGCFVKLYMPQEKTGLFKTLKNFFFAKARSEFESLCQLRDQGIPVVAPVAWGQCGGTFSCLITREIPDCTAAGDYFYRAVGEENRDCPAFFAGWCAFVRAFLRSGFHHPDFHNGNILYREKENDFQLVDVYGVSRHRRPNVHDMGMIVREFGDYLPKIRLLELIDACGIADPEHFYREMFLARGRDVQKDFARRLLQLHRGYAKFVQQENGLLRNLSGDRKPIPLEHTVQLTLSPEQAEKVREMDFYLRLCNIPRIRVAAVAAPGALFVERGSSALPPGAAEDLQERLTLCGLDPGQYHLMTDRFGRAAVCPGLLKM